MENAASTASAANGPTGRTTKASPDTPDPLDGWQVAKYSLQTQTLRFRLAGQSLSASKPFPYLSIQ